MKELRLRPLAGEDLIRRTLYYRKEGGDDLGDQFFDVVRLLSYSQNLHEILDDLDEGT